MSKQTTIQDPLAVVARGLAGRTPNEARLRSLLLRLALLAECPPDKVAQARGRIFPPPTGWRRWLGELRPLNAWWSSQARALWHLERELRAGAPVSQAIKTRLRWHLRPSWRHLLLRAEASGQLGPALRWVASQPALSPRTDRGLSTCFLVDGCERLMVAGGASLLTIPSFGRMLQEMLGDRSGGIAAHVTASQFIGLAVLALGGLAYAWHFVCATRLGPWATGWISYWPKVGQRHRWLRQEEAAASIAWHLSQDGDLLAALQQLHEAIACPWLRPRLKRAHDAILAGHPWQDAWIAQGLVAPEDAWLLHAGARQGEPGKALHTLSLILRARARHLAAYRLAWMPLATTLLAGAVIGWHILWIYHHFWVFSFKGLWY